MLWPPNSSYIFQAESILFYRIFVNIWKDLGVYIIKIFIFLNFPQNYECWTWVYFCKILHNMQNFYKNGYIHMLWLLLQFSIWKHFTGFLYIYERCEYYQDFHFLQFSTKLRVLNIVQFYQILHIWLPDSSYSFQASSFFYFTGDFLHIPKVCIFYSGFLYLKFLTLYHIDKG